MEIEISPYIAFEATGTDRQGRRIPCRRAPLAYLRGLKYGTKSVWGILPSGNRKLLYRVVN